MNSDLLPGDGNVQRKKRRTILRAGSALLLCVMKPALAYSSEILAVRVWPASEYTRVALESNSELKATHFIVTDPLRLVIDIEGLILSETLKELVAKVGSDDPYIQKIRVGQNSPDVVRLVFDLKAEVKPQVFTLKPIGAYKHRLVFDLYPSSSPDELRELIEDRKFSSPDVASVNTSVAHPVVPSEDQKERVTVVRSAAEKVQNKRRQITVALDPGHGGEDPGAIGRGGSKEKNVVLAIAKGLKQKLEADHGMKVVLTRDGDYFVPLHVRVRKARKAKADLFVSIHADAWINKSASGSSVFVLSERGASSTAARMLAAKENDADLIGGVNLRGHEKMLAGVLLDLSTTAQIKDSMELAKSVLSQIGMINRLHKGQVEQAGFAVLKAPDIPSILVETAFISNPAEEAKLVDPRHQDKISDAIVAGIIKYFTGNPSLLR